MNKLMHEYTFQPNIQHQIDLLSTGFEGYSIYPYSQIITLSVSIYDDGYIIKTSCVIDGKQRVLETSHPLFCTLKKQKTTYEIREFSILKKKHFFKKDEYDNYLALLMVVPGYENFCPIEAICKNCAEGKKLLEEIKEAITKGVKSAKTVVKKTKEVKLFNSEFGFSWELFSTLDYHIIVGRDVDHENKLVSLGYYDFEENGKTYQIFIRDIDEYQEKRNEMIINEKPDVKLLKRFLFFNDSINKISFTHKDYTNNVSYETQANFLDFALADLAFGPIGALAYTVSANQTVTINKGSTRYEFVKINFDRKILGTDSIIFSDKIPSKSWDRFKSFCLKINEK